MAHVLAELWPCLLIAFLLGALLAWLLRRGAATAVAAPGAAAPDLSGFALRSELPKLPTAPDLSAFALRSELPVVPPSPDLSAFVRRDELPKPPPDRSGELAVLRSELTEWRTALAAERAGRADDVARLEALLAEHGRAHEAQAAVVVPVPVAAEPAVGVAPPPAAKAPRRPRGPRRPDDLKLIHGVGPVLERRLHRLGVTRFIQIARWTDRHIDRIEARLDSVPDRIRREGWVKDAARLHAEKYGRRR